MKANPFFLTILLVTSGILFLSSCEHDVYDSAKIENTKDLIAPSDFDWKTSQQVICSLTSPASTVVSIYTDAACNDENLLVEGIVLKADEAKEITLNMPADKTDFYVQYPTANGKGVLKGALAATTRNKNKNIILLLPNNVEEEFKDQLLHYYYPSKNTQGTLMFEDLYPELGDFDFNDFVIGYNAACYFSGFGDITTDGFTFTFKIRAIGGSLPYRPALRLKGFAMKNLKDAEISYTSTRAGIELKLVEGRSDEQDVIFIITGTEKLRQGGFFNTNPEKATDSDLPVLTCKVEKDNLNSPGTASQYARLASNLPTFFDFFLQNTNNNDEIHFKGFNPTDMSNMAPDTEFIHKGRKLVWAIAVPEEVRYAKEGIDILNIYQGNFQSWVSTGGTKNKDWYENPKRPEGLFPSIN